MNDYNVEQDKKHLSHFKGTFLNVGFLPEIC